VATVAAHELAKQWFGNLVTMEWWIDLWLNEGFATWVSYLATNSLFPEWKIWSQFCHESSEGLRLDDLAESHPIEPLTTFLTHVQSYGNQMDFLVVYLSAAEAEKSSCQRNAKCIQDPILYTTRDT
ncbi:Peptidase M1, membrane alanine aminopeptidase, N-terminal, partial [Sesbania bispinosa]